MTVGGQGAKQDSDWPGLCEDGELANYQWSEHQSTSDTYANGV